MRVVFLTLLLGLVTGPQRIELAVEGDPAAVEILLDDEIVAVLDHPPWAAAIDLGEDPLPGELVARALDPAGREVARATQLVNLPHERASLQIAIERNDRGAAIAASLVWQSADGEPPGESSLLLDGRALDLVDGRAPLPELGPATSHVLEARARSASGVRGAALQMGGAYSDQVTTALVGVPIRSNRARAAEEVGRCLVGPHARPLEVQSLDRGEGEVLMVASREGRYALRRAMLGERPRKIRGAVEPGAGLFKLRMPADSRVTFYWAELAVESRPLGEGRRTELFGHSAPLELHSQNLWSLIRSIEPTGERPAATPRLADAAGVAVLNAASSGRPRVVVVVSLGDEPDASRLEPGQIRELARSLHVPLQVWSLSDPPNAAWGAAAPLLRSTSELRWAHIALRDELESQTIAWVPGSIPLHRIGVRPDCSEIELAH